MDVAAWITAVATVGLVLVGAWAGWAAVRTLKQARSDSEARTRPYITVDLAPEGAPEWPIFHPATPSTLVWDLEPYVADPLNHERMEFFDRFNAVWDGRSESVLRHPTDRLDVISLSSG